MSRYIDADALIKDIENCSCETWSNGINRTWWAQAIKIKDNIKQCIERQPTADVVEVRHGLWIRQVRDYDTYWVTEGYECSICGLDLMDNDYKYCPECGSKMNKRSKTDE